MSLPLPNLMRGWRAALVAVVAACAAPSAAQAGCGDHVVIRDATSALPATAPDHGTPQPCDGPNCHSAPAHDPIAPVSPPTVASPKDIVTPGGLEPPPDAGRRFPLPTSDACPPDGATAIFHPPRAG